MARTKTTAPKSRTQGKSTRKDVEESIAVSRERYNVERIIDISTNGPLKQREGYDELTWEPEAILGSIYDMVVQFIYYYNRENPRKKVPQTWIKPSYVGGCSNLEAQENDNYVSFAQLLAAINETATHYKIVVGLPILEFKGEIPNNSISILLKGQHFYVFYRQNDKIFEADGNNLCQRD